MSTAQPSFKDFAIELLDRLNGVTDRYLDDYDPHTAFDYLVAELFETTVPGRFYFTDGPKDGGIDFFIQEPPAYSIYQCKCPSQETLQAASSPPSYDDAAIEELLSAISFLRDKDTQYDLKHEVFRLRADYQRDMTNEPETASLSATLALAGELTPAARQRLDAHRKELQCEGIQLAAKTWLDLYRAFHQLAGPETADVRLTLSLNDVGKELLRHRDYCYILAHGYDFYEAWRRHEWSLFDWNVRLHLRRSPINQRIVGSLMTAKTRKISHHLNNGILVTCRNYTIDETKKVFRAEGAQVINGCQTICAFRDAYERLSPDEQAEFRKHVRVQVKLIKTTSPELISQLVVTTNDQNPMNPRNLKSNTAEQKDLQKNFRVLPAPWFYQRKDGEWDSLMKTTGHGGWFKPSHYSYRPGSGRPRYRIIDNEDLARTWHSWIGYSQDALKGGLRYFEDDTSYTQVFLRRPNLQFWDEFRNEPYFNPSDPLFEAGTPAPRQYLLAYTVGQFIAQKRISWQQNRLEALRRGIAQGMLKGDLETGHVLSPQSQVDEFLASDNDYKINIMINNMREVLIELASYVLALRYGALTAEVCKRLLDVPSTAHFVESAYAPQLLPPEEQSGEEILGPVYAFLRYCVIQYYHGNFAEIQAAPRLKAYFFSRKTVHKLREMVASTNKRIRDYNPEWKLAGASFLESLPALALPNMSA